MPKIDLKNLDKSDWKTYRFDQIVKNISERVEPGETDLEIYIGLEHIDAESIHIKRFGQPSDVEGQKLKCYPGDVIFGKRRAYQRKASVVITEAICSAHAFVLRANPEVIDPKLLPFFLHSDLFMHRAVDISAGGLSPTINWGILKIQEFLLPPKEQQAELAELLWAMDEVIEKDLAVLEKLERLEKSILQEIDDLIFGKANSIGDFIDIKNGYAFSGSELSEEKTPFVVVTPGNFMIGGGFSSVKFKYFTGQSYDEKFRFSNGDMIVTMTDLSKEGDTLGFPALIPEVKGIVFLHNQRLGKIIINDDSLKPMFLYHVLRTTRYRKHILNAATKTTVRHTYPDRIKSFKFNKPNDEIQRFYIKKMEDSTILLNNSAQKISASKALQKSLINEVF